VRRVERRSGMKRRRRRRRRTSHEFSRGTGVVRNGARRGSENAVPGRT